ncbi:ketoacyl-ACP synthase III [Massilibacteroides sp.]|uniref:3-oxoacyl-ACP synthase III family protein n=1 Tax=Massilibacteroides sp. TaxID=2034766 RepID=UPI00261E18A5|nr:ketoacyl-ACP synthase III [Massilibacteroides sp.]MDD4515958.1 ketoacyl-ACP synthase III [Massilibacteroides sp.]
MAFLSIPNVRIAGISACVPKRIEQCSDLPILSKEESLNFINTTGVVSRRVADENMCSSDLCYYAAEKMILDLGWSRDSIDCLIFVTQTPDYIIPSTSPLLQTMLNLSETCLTLDISLGCSGYVYALNVISSLISHGSIKRGLLLAGDTILKTCSPNDKSTYPLFGDAGSATAIEFIENDDSKLLFNLKSDGKGSDVIRIREGGFRNKATVDSFIMSSCSENILRNKLQLELDGMDVFTFGISKAPRCVQELLDFYDISIDSIDYFTFHQANLFMNERIRKKMKIPAEKTPNSIRDFGNTSCATIPLTMVTELRKQLLCRDLTHLICGFGVGLSWGSACFQTKNICCPDLIEI